MDAHRTYHESVDWAALTREHPIGEPFLEFVTRVSRDELRARQEALFARCAARAWETPFYRRLWGAQGIEPGDVRGLDDLPRLPSFDKSDVMASLERAPPFGDFAGPLDVPRILHTTSGTTGKPQVLLFGPKSREVQNLLLGRLYRFQGLRPDDVVHSVYGHGMVNGGHYVREAVTHWTQATFLPAGTGVETRSAQQVALMREFGATAIVGFVDYVKKLADVARAQGLEPGRDIPVRMITGHLGREDRAVVGAAWGGAECFDWYGVGDTGAIAAEGPDHDGLYVMEDAHWLEICDIESGAAAAPGAPGDMVVTCLYKDDVYPVIRFNTHDVTRRLPGASKLGWAFDRIEGFLGRSDNMVKIRGINVFPHAIGALLSEVDGFAAEYVCLVRRAADGRDDLVVLAETDAAPEARAGWAEAARAKLRTTLGIDVVVEPAARGQTAPLTQIDQRQKPIRLIDERAR